MLVRADRGGLAITDCLEYKDHIKQLGGKWDAKNKAWRIAQGAILDIMRITRGIQITREVEALLKDEAAKQIHLEKLKKGEIKPAPHAFLFEHQRKCVDIAKLYNRFAFFLDTGKLQPCPLY